MCFVREWNCEFFARAMALWLSPKMTVAIGSSSSLTSWEKSDCSQIASLVAWVCATYSASQEDRETVGCLFEDQLIAPLPILNMFWTVCPTAGTSYWPGLVGPTGPGVHRPGRYSLRFVRNIGMGPIRYNGGKDLGPADMIINCLSYRPFLYQGKSDSPFYQPAQLSGVLVFFLSLMFWNLM